MDESLLEMPVRIKGSAAKLKGSWSGSSLMVWGEFSITDPVLFIRPEDRAAMAQCSIEMKRAKVAALEAELARAKMELMVAWPGDELQVELELPFWNGTQPSGH